MDQLSKENKEILENTFLGIEFGSTRIKAVLVDGNYETISSGSHDWENQFEDGVWTYSNEMIWDGLQKAYSHLKKNYQNKYGSTLTSVDAIGFSGMMHGYLPFDQQGNQLVPFRTWRNTTTREASEKLTKALSFNIPQRWSVSHLYQAILNKEQHVKDISFITTLAGYVHWKLTDHKVLGIGEASGVFPIDSEKETYHADHLDVFSSLIKEENSSLNASAILPRVLSAGEDAGKLTAEGALLLDPSGDLKPGIPFAPPEGDAGTGMVATNSVAKRTGNVSAGTSIFSMVVLEKALSDYYEEIDMVTTPTGKPVAMVHCNNFTSDINAWANLFKEVTEGLGNPVDSSELFTFLFNKAMEADDDLGGLVSCNYFSGEPITGFEEGRPLVIRMPDSSLTIANFMRTQIYSALATLKIGMDILIVKESVESDYLIGHGGFFKTPVVGQQLMADATRTPIAVMKTAGEGGPWGMAVLAAFAIKNKEYPTLEGFLTEEVFAEEDMSSIHPSKEGMENFDQFMKRYKAMLPVERAAIENLK
ncbi:xylulokinase [Lacticigenium naphthae]|uniref:xylulokinase n=1 Tax=Lacticigenium naphthae TaxID=515351 RepID=UPI00041D00B1|nr:FGGY-family carbohydrate kinase [Lacticigenium naphthae]